VRWSRQVDPGFDCPLDITTGLWFLGAWTVWNTLTPQQQALTDPDFRAQAEQGAALSALQVQQLNLRRGALGSQMRQFMQRYDLLLTPSVAVPAFDARPAGQAPMTPRPMLGWTPYSATPST
jgi:aspartyl-tRNA(Asn)/glutamyl-tRNA(Gln) amidotransferase subunit A